MLHAAPISASILLANEPLAYRQALVRAFESQRPNLRVFEVAPRDLDAAVQKYAPVVVICDRLTELVETCVSAWVLLYPGGTRQVMSSLFGKEERVGDLDLDALLLFVDRVRTLPTSR